MKKQAEEFTNLPESADQVDELPSKSQRKRDALRSVALAKALLELPQSKRGRFNLTAEISDALKLADEIRSHGARKRQLHYLGKLLRNSANYETYLQQHEHPHVEQPTPSQRTEPVPSPDLIMRDRLLDDLAGTMSDLRNQYPNANLQLIRQLVNRINKTKSDAEAIETQSGQELQGQELQSNQHPENKDSRQVTALLKRLSATIEQGRIE